MSQGKQSKFLVIYFSVLGVGALALGYLGWSASATAEEAETKYKNAVTELDRLERAPLSRTKENAAKKSDLVKTYVDQVQALNTSMMAWQMPLNESESNESFQKKLNEAVKAAKANGISSQVKLPDKFDFGMDKYLAGFPVPGTAPRLSAQLDSLIFLTNAAMGAGISSIDSLTRTELPFESEQAAESTAAPGTKGPKPVAAPKPKPGEKKPVAKGAPPAVDETAVLERQPVTLTVTGKNHSVIALAEALANTSPAKMAPHFFVIRTLRVENQLKDGPPKTQTVEVKEVEVTGADGKKTVIKHDAMYLLGNEQVKMYLDLDLVRFVAEPVAPAPKPSAKTANAK